MILDTNGRFFNLDPRGRFVILDTSSRFFILVIVADLDPESGRFVALATRGRFAIWDTWGRFVNYSGPLTPFSDFGHWWLIFHLLDLNG